MVVLSLLSLKLDKSIGSSVAECKSHIVHCVVCARYRADQARQLMGQLPLARVTPSRPFTHTGVEYAGPLSIKSWKGRGSKAYKAWMRFCMFLLISGTFESSNRLLNQRINIKVDGGRNVEYLT